MPQRIIFFTGDIDEESLFTAATLAEGNTVCIIVGKKFKSFIEKSWSYGVEADFYFCQDSDLLAVLSSFALLFSDKTDCYYEVLGEAYKKIKFENIINCTCQTLFELNSTFQNNIEYFLKTKSFDNDFISKAKYFSSVLISTKEKELELFIGKSNLSKSSIEAKISSKTNELLGRDEFQKLKTHYDFLLSKHPEDANKYLENKIIGIEKYYKHSLSSNGRLIEVEGFPVAYKYLSTFLFLSSEEISKTKNYTASYITLFRAFEVYCDGLLLSQDKAKIDIYIDYKGNQFQDCFQVMKGGRYIKPAGFGPKWGAIREARLTNTLPLVVVQKMELHRKLRNISALTHGDVLSSLEVYSEFRNIIQSIIEYFENKFCQQSLNWFKLKDDMLNQFVYKMLPIVGEMLVDSYCQPCITMK